MKKKPAADTIDDKTRQRARRDFIMKVGSAAAGAAAITGVGLLPKRSDSVYAQEGDKGATQIGKFARQSRQAAAMVDERKGVIIPNIAAVRIVMERLKERMRKNETFKASFRANPRLVLGEAGLSEDVQNELLQDIASSGTVLAKEGCTMTCNTTCNISSCLITKLVPW